ncbi:ketosynthase chain-length factor [Actinomadura chokoriensis]|uniref:Ketosynthase chain-length factor n=1 Tax=Actinomadura chokoriensis TaxID=454156 RepID=A0ABV4R6X7_9ACTN
MSAPPPLITGLGVVAPTGIGHAEYWRATLAAVNAIGPITRFDSTGYPVRLAGEIGDVDVAGLVPARLAVQTDRWTQLGLAATELALADAGIDPAGLPEYDMAVITASSSGGNEFGQREIEKLWARGPGHVGAYQSTAWFYAASTGQISIRHGMRGPCGVLVAEQAGGLDAIASARRALRADARVAVTGGTEAPLSPYALVCQLTSGRLSRSDDPARGYLPFDAGAGGHVPAEGGAILIMETAASARERGVHPGYGALLGYAATFDPPPGSGREPGLRRAVEAALADARLDPTDIDVVFADAAGVPSLDREEATVLRAVFGPYGVPVTAPKTLTGRMYAGGAPLDVAAAVLALRDAVIPPSSGAITTAVEHRLDLVREGPREAPLRTALVLARGYGGFNSALIVGTDP